VVDLRVRFELCLAKAAEAMENARRTRNEEERANYLRAAQSWAALARQVEELERYYRDQE
jgi:hypothetical protein